MLTKEEYAISIIQTVIEDWQKGDPFNTGLVMQSSAVAVAAEFLGLLDDDSTLKEYAESRGGMISRYLVMPCSVSEDSEFECKFLTVREVLSLLPDSNKQEKK